mmetsp:Transcript_144227/g.203986  ORF Transcript_144227/g.203986 Transcript_144227/m.203986 type:complete len:151 (-) Transcript_144227:151-603(-)
MSENNNIKNPGVFKEPEPLRFKDLYRFVGREEIKLNSTFKNFRGALPAFGAMLGSFLFGMFVVSKQNKYYFQGPDGRGGQILTMNSRISDEDYSYNREIQRMRFLQTFPHGDDPHLKTSSTLLADLGVKETNKGLDRQYASKESPNPYYF